MRLKRVTAVYDLEKLEPGDVIIVRDEKTGTEISLKILSVKEAVLEVSQILLWEDTLEYEIEVSQFLASSKDSTVRKSLWISDAQ